MGGHLLNPVVQAIAVGLRDLTMKCLLFNWRGVGESEGHPSGDREDADRDFRAALAVAAASGELVMAAGYSFGGACAIRIAASAGLPVVAVAPPPALFDAACIGSASRSMLLIAAEYDPFAPPDDYSSIISGAPHVRLETIANTGHDFAGRLAAVREKVRGAAISI
jgi:alpha/beta superfamily hydrolase